MKNRTITKIANINATTIKAKMMAKSSSPLCSSSIRKNISFVIDGSAHIPHAKGKATEQVSTILLMPSERGSLVFVVTLLSILKPSLIQYISLGITLGVKNKKEQIGGDPKSMLGENNVTPVAALLPFLSFQFNPLQGFQLSV